jgi:hypothetical protein
MFSREVGQWCNHRADCMRAIGVEEVWRTVKAYIDTLRGDRAKVRVSEGW